MSNKRFQFSSLVHVNKSPEEVIKKLVFNSEKLFIKINKKRDLSYELIGPFKSANEEKHRKIRNELKMRSINLNINRDDLVNRAAESIYKAQVADRRTNEGRINVIFKVVKEVTQIKITLDVASSNDPEIDECMDYYAFICFSYLGELMDLSLQDQLATHFKKEVY